MKLINLSTILVTLFLVGIAVTMIGVFWWPPAFYIGVIFLAVGSLYEFIDYI